MSTTPVPENFQTLLSRMMDTVTAQTGLRTFKVGNPILTLMEAAAQGDLRASQSLLDYLRSTSLDDATDQALVLIAQSEGTDKLPALPAQGFVNFTDTSFTKVESRINGNVYSASAGTLSLYLMDTSDFPASGSVYVGRGTTNEEGPIPYSSKTSERLNLSNALTLSHATGESVIQAQGGERVVNAGTTVSVLSGIGASIEFKTLYSVTLLDGESQVLDVAVAAATPGEIGNVIAGSITEVTSSVQGLSVNNTKATYGGREIESNYDLRERVRKLRQSRSKGTSLALESGAIGAADDSGQRVVSAVISEDLGKSSLYIDNGKGYEESFGSSPFEVLTSSAIGGEQYFELQNKPVAQANIVSSAAAPWSLYDGITLSLIVESALSTHTFRASEFKNVDAASPYEVIASINANDSLLFSAKVVENGTKVALFAKSEYLHRIEISAVSGDANDEFNFPLLSADTLNLYKNGVLLLRDSKKATVLSQSQADWVTNTSSWAVGDTVLSISIDNTPTLDVKWSQSDFNAYGDSYLSSFLSLDSWVEWFQSKLPGVDVKALNGRIQFESVSGKALSISSTTGSVTSRYQMFLGTEDEVGLASDYSLNINTAQIKLVTPLTIGDYLSVGTENPSAFIEIGNNWVAPLSISGELTFVVDGAVEVLTSEVPNTLSYNLTFAGNVATYTRTTSGVDFTTVFTQGTDWAILNAGSNSLVPVKSRISGFTTNTFKLEQEVSANITTTLTNYDFIRSRNLLQTLTIANTTYTAQAFADLVNEQIVGVTASVYKNKVRIYTNNQTSSGEVALVSINDAAEVCGLFSKQIVSNPAQVSALLKSQTQWPATTFRARDIQSTANINKTFTASIGDVDSLHGRQPFYPGATDLVRFTPRINNGADFIFGASNSKNFDTVVDFIDGTPDVNGVGSFEVTTKNENTFQNKYQDGLVSLVPPVAIAPDDYLSFIVDGDSSRNFKTQLSKEFSVKNTSWSTTLEFDDDQMFDTFGSDSSKFDDYAVFTQARGGAFLNSATLKSVFKSKRFGLEGEETVVSIASPKAPSSALSIEEKPFNGKNTVTIFPIGGGLKSNTLLQNTHLHSIVLGDPSTTWTVPVVGVSNTWTITFNDSTKYAHNLKAGDLFWMNSVSAPLSVGLKLVDSVTDNTISFIEAAVDASISADISFLPQPAGTTEISTTNVTVNYNYQSALDIVTLNITNSKFDIGDKVYFTGVKGTNHLLPGIYTVLQKDASTVKISNFKKSGFATSSQTIAGLFKISAGWSVRRSIVESKFTFVAGKAVRDAQNWVTLTLDPTPACSELWKSSLETSTAYITTTDPEFTPNSYQIFQGPSEDSIKYYDASGAAGPNTLDITLSFIPNIAPVTFTAANGDAFTSSDEAFSVKGSDSSMITVVSNDRIDFNDSYFESIPADFWQNGYPHKVSPDAISIFPITWPTIAQVETLVNASETSVQMDAFGTPATFLSSSTLNEFYTRTDNKNTGVSVPYFKLYDGLNSVLSTNIVGAGTTLTLKWPLKADLTGYSFTSNQETIKLAPVTPKNISEFLAIQEYSALPSVISSKATDDGFGLQLSRIDPGSEKSLQFSGGSANSRVINAVGAPEIKTIYRDLFESNLNYVATESVTFKIPKGLTGFTGNQWVKIENSQPKTFEPGTNNLATIYKSINKLAISYSFFISDLTNKVVSISKDGNLFVAKVNDTSVWGDFSRGSIVLIANNTSGSTVYLEGEIVGLDPEGRTLWVNGTGTLGYFTACNVSFYNQGMPRKGAKLNIGGVHNLTVQGMLGGRAANSAATSLSVTGTDTFAADTTYTNQNTFTWEVPDDQVCFGKIVGYSTGSDYDYLIVKPQDYSYAQSFSPNSPVHSVTPFAHIGDNAQITVLNKLELPTTKAAGQDGYKYNTGLLAEVNRIVYGDNDKSFAYPGLHASGTIVDISGPLVKRLSISLVVRASTSNTKDLVARIKNSVAQAINSAFVGQSVAISDIVQAANSLTGVESVVITSPIYDTENDIIPVKINEKALILDPESDISVLINE